MSDPVDPLRERADNLLSYVAGDGRLHCPTCDTLCEPPATSDCATCLARDLLADRASLQARIRELEQERDDWRSRFGLQTSTGWQTAEQAQASQVETYRAVGDTLRAQLAAAEAREQAVRAVVKLLRTSHRYDSGSYTSEVCRMFADKLDAALASTGQPQEGVK